MEISPTPFFSTVERAFCCNDVFVVGQQSLFLRDRFIK